MGLQNAVVNLGATVTPAGGVATTFGPDGTVVARGVSISDVSEPDIRTRDSYICKNTNGTLQPDGVTWSNHKRELKFVSPDVIDGKTLFPWGSVTIVINPMFDAAKLAHIKSGLVQALIDADFSNFFATGSVA